MNLQIIRQQKQEILEIVSSNNRALTAIIQEMNRDVLPSICDKMNNEEDDLSNGTILDIHELNVTTREVLYKQEKLISTLDSVLNSYSGESKLDSGMAPMSMSKAKY